MRDQDKILNFLKVTGPTIPSKVAKNIKTEILLASAHLSDLAAQAKVKISHLKIGGSPLYYLPGQEEQLFGFAAGNINVKDLQVLERLKDQKVLREAQLDLLSKVALRSLKDFAMPLHVTIGDTTELFWKWHLLPMEETNAVIARMLGLQQEEQPLEQVAAEIPPVAGLPHSLNLEQPMQNGETQIPSDALSVDTETATDLEEALLKESLERQTLLRTVENKVRKAKVPRQKRVQAIDNLISHAENYLWKLNITVEEKEVIRKNAEINLLVKVPSVVGVMKYFCKAKQKKRCDEKDLSSAYIEAQLKKLPLLFIYTGELTAKAQQMLEANAFENAIIKRLSNGTAV